MNEQIRKLRSLKVNDIRPPKVPKAVRDQARMVRSKWRKIVTGSEKKRVRDFVRETQEQPKYVKLFDKVNAIHQLSNQYRSKCILFMVNFRLIFNNSYLWTSIALNSNNPNRSLSLSVC